jgi:hypothetical protein
LKELSISNTDIDSGLEHLPESLEKLHCFCFDRRDYNPGCKEIQKELKNYFNKDGYYEL